MNSDTVLHGIRWNLITTVIRRVISLVLLVFLASWLTQSDFGTFRTYGLILAIVSIFAVIGLDSNYITEPRNRRINLITFAQIGLGLGLLFSIAIALASTWLGSLYHNPELGIILRFTSLFVLVEVFRNLLRSVAQMQMKFKLLALAETWNVVFYTLVGLVLISRFRFVWLYVLLFFLGNLVEALYLFIRVRLPRFLSLSRLMSLKWLYISFANLKRNAGFLLNVSIIRLVNSFAGNAPILLLGTITNPAMMGLYFFATQLIGVPVNMFTLSVGQVFYPVFALSDRSKTLQSIQSYTRLTLSMGIPLLILYAFGLDKLIPLVFRGKWDDALPLIYSLIPYFGSSMLNDPISGIPFICRKPHWELIWNIISLGLRILALLLGIGYSFPFAILLFSIGSAVMNLSFYFMSLYLLKARLMVAARNLLGWGVIIATLSMGLRAINGNSLSLLYAPLLFGMYFVAVYLSCKPMAQDLRRILR
jgi:O-antigen/teichoic acid export membrane protein